MFFGETIITYSFAVRFLYRKDQHALAGLPSDSAVVKDGDEIVVSVGEALMHLRNRLSAVHQIK